MRATEFISEAELDPSGWGGTPMGTDVDYFGLRVKMRPSTFLKLSHPLTSSDANPEIEKHMQGGGKIAYPFLEIKDPVEWEDGDFSQTAKVVNHEGRNRMTQWIKLKGDDPIQVNLFLRGANRRRYITDDMIQALSQGLISQTGQLIKNPFEANTALEEDMTRRGFLGALGAAAATGAQAATGLKMPKEFNVLSNNPQNEITLQKTALGSGLKGPELAQFLAQMKHESWNFERMKEKPMGKGYFEKRYGVQYAPKTAKILGNKRPGDGERYHGRGYVQLTGRDNYRMAGDALGLDLLNHPELAAKPDVAAKIAVWYWKTRVKPNVTNFKDTSTVTKYINPAMRGLQDRHENFKDYLRII